MHHHLGWGSEVGELIFPVILSSVRFHTGIHADDRQQNRHTGRPPNHEGRQRHVYTGKGKNVRREGKIFLSFLPGKSEFGSLPFILEILWHPPERLLDTVCLVPDQVLGSEPLKKESERQS